MPRWIIWLTGILCCAAIVLAPPCTPAMGQTQSEEESESPEPGSAGADDDLPSTGEDVVTGDEPPATDDSNTTGGDSSFDADESAQTSDTAPTISSATRTQEPASHIGSSVSVITAEQIARSGRTTVAELLRGIPGVDVVNQGGPGRVSSIFLRGANSEQTKVLLDGIPLNDPISPGRAFDFSTLTLDNIDRIEILRGPQSTLYGSDAIGGVILIFTKKGARPFAASVGVSGGAFNTSREFAHVAAASDQTYFSLGGSYFDTNGFSAADRRLPGNSEPDGFFLGTLAGRAGWTPFENFDFDFVFRYNRATSEIDDGGGPFMDDPNQVNFTEQAFFRAQIRYENLPGWWEQILAFNFADHHRENRDDLDLLHPFDSFFSHFNGQLRMVDWQNNFLLTDANTLTVGTMYSDENGDSAFFGDSFFGPFSGDSAEQSLRDAAVYAQDQIRVADSWFTTLGVRQDHYSQAGTANTYRATSLYRFPELQTAFRGSLGTAFKAPTIFQLFDGFSGNPLLMPEESKGWDCGVDQPLFDGQLVLSGTYFRNDFSNLIDFDPQTFRFFNVGSALASGVEGECQALLTERTTATLSYTHLQTRDRATDLPLLRRPRDKAAMRLSRTIFDGRGSTGLTLLYVGNRDDRDFSVFPDRRVELPHYIVLNGSMQWQVTDHLEFHGNVDNLFNEKYQEIFGFGTAGISAYAGVTLRR